MNHREVIDLIEEATAAGQTHLDLSSKGLTSIPPALRRLTSLTTLSLRANQLTHVPAALMQLPNLAMLDLAHNQLMSVPSEFAQLTNLTTLNLSYNGLIRIPSEFAQLTNLTTLNLSYSGLTNVPSEFVQLTNLTTLYLAGNRLRSIRPELGQLTNLKELDLHQNPLTSLPAELGQLKNLRTLDLHRNQLASIAAELGQLTNLTTLDLHDNQLSTVPVELGQLKNLRTLDLHGNQLTSIPAELGQLANLTELDLHRNQLTSIPAELGQLTNLTTLDLHRNQLTSIPAELGQLTNLRIVNLRHNHIGSLPKDLLDLSVDLELWERFAGPEGVFLKGNPLTSPPIEVLRQGKSAARRWFEALEEEGEEKLNEVKVLLVGYGGAGKTSLVRRLTTDKFRPHEVKTHGVRITRWPRQIAGEQVTVHLWDYGGQGIMQATHRVFFSHRTLYVLVIDARQESDPEEWLSTIGTVGGDSPVLVVVNKIDENTFGLNETDLRRKYPNIRSFHHVSCKKGDGIGRLQEDLMTRLAAVEMRRTPWPRRWAAVRQNLERRRRDHITYSEYQSICRKEGVEEAQRQRELIAVLHELGVMLHFRDPHLYDTQVLNPEWATTGIYKLINSRELKRYKGRLPWDKLDWVLNEEVLPEEKEVRSGKTTRYDPREQAYIVDLMHKFELCYRLEDHTIFVPDLLTEQEPAQGLPAKVGLRFYFEYDFLPVTIMPRFMVKSSADLDPDLCWRTGAVLKNDKFGAVAVVRKEARPRRISVEVASDRPRDYFTTIRKTILEINDSFQKLDVIEWVPLPGDEQQAVKYLDLLGHEIAGRGDIFVGSLGKTYSVGKLLGSIETRAETEQRIRDATRGVASCPDLRGAKIGGVYMDQRRTKIKGPVIASPLGDGASVWARDITVVKQSIDNAIGLDEKDRATLKQAADALEKLSLDDGDRRDAEYHLGQIVDELNKPRPEARRLKRLWNSLNENAPAIGTILSAIQLIAQAMPR